MTEKKLRQFGYKVRKYRLEKKLRQFGYKVRKYRLVNNVAASFNIIIMGKVTETSQRKKN